MQANSDASPEASGKADVPKRRYIPYLDTLRAIAITLVIVNHTCGPWLLSLEARCPNWWFGVVFFFACKIAVPLFVMISGALLLPRIDSYRKHGQRIARIAIALVVISIPYYFFLVSDPSLIDFIDRFWHGKIASHLWYLYMYLGLLIMMPLLQRMVSAMEKRDFVYFIVICLGVATLVPMLASLYEPFKFAQDFQLPLFGGYIGMLVIGHYVANVVTPSKRTALVAVAVFAVCLVGLVATTGFLSLERTGKGYLALENRTYAPIIVMAACVFVVARALSDAKQAQPRKDTRIRRAWGAFLKQYASCSFGMYLMHLFFVNALKPQFASMRTVMPDIPALLIYELAIIALSFAITWLLRLIPPVRKIL